jgi:hypothetical protein
MRNLKYDVGHQNQCNIWPAGGHCGPGNGNGSVCNAVRNFVPNCNASGYGQGCSGMGGFGGPQGPNPANYGGNVNNMNHGGTFFCSC